MSTTYGFRLPIPGKSTCRQWTVLSFPRSPVLYWRSSLFELSGTTDRTLALGLAAKHELEDQLRNALNSDIRDSLSVLEYESSRQEDGLITLAVFFVKGSSLVAIELSAPQSFNTEARTIFECYADLVRQKLARAILEKPIGKRKLVKTL